MTTIHRDEHGDLAELAGHGNQGRSWAINLRDSGCDVPVCVRNDETRGRSR